MYKRGAMKAKTVIQANKPVEVGRWAKSVQLLTIVGAEKNAERRKDIGEDSLLIIPSCCGVSVHPNHVDH